MVMYIFRDQVEKSIVCLGDVYVDKICFLVGEIVELYKVLFDMKVMKVNFNLFFLYIGKIFIVVLSVNYLYGENFLWFFFFEFIIKSGDCIYLKGSNGSGKIILLRLIIGSFVFI